MKKRMISMMLCICILLSLVPVTAFADENEPEPEPAQPRMIYLDNRSGMFEGDPMVEIYDLEGHVIEGEYMDEVGEDSGVYCYEVKTDRTDVQFLFRTGGGAPYTAEMDIPADENNMFIPGDFIPGGEDEDGVYTGTWTTYAEPEQPGESEQPAEPAITGLYSITVLENIDGETVRNTYYQGKEIVITENTTCISLTFEGTNLESLIDFTGDEAPCWVYFCGRMEVALVGKVDADHGVVYEIDPEAGEAYMTYYGAALQDLPWPTETTEIEYINSADGMRIGTGFTIRRDAPSAETEPTLTGISVTLNGKEITSGNFTVTSDDEFFINFHGTALDKLEVCLKYSLINYVYKYNGSYLEYNEDNTVATVDLSSYEFTKCIDYAAISYGTDANNLVESDLAMKFETTSPCVDKMTLLVDGEYYGPKETAYITSATQSILIEVEGRNLNKLGDQSAFRLYQIDCTINLVEHEDKIESRSDTKIVFDLSSWKNEFQEKCTDATWVTFDFGGSATVNNVNPLIQAVNLAGNIVIHAFDDPNHRDGWHNAAIEVYTQQKNEDGSGYGEETYLTTITVDKYENIICFEYDEHLVYRFKWRQGNHEGCDPGEHDNECSFIIYADSNVIMNTNVFNYEDGQNFLTIASKKTHKPADAIIEWVDHPTCKQQGMYHHIINCTDCEKPFSEDTHIVPVLDHNADYYENGRCTQTCGVEGCTECQPCGEWLFEVETVEMDLVTSLEIGFVINKDRIPTNTDYILINHVQADGSKVTKKVKLADAIDMGDSIVVTYDGLAAKQMMDDIHVAAYNANGECLSNPEAPAYNVWNYISKVLDGDYSDEMKTFVADVAFYGAAAQDYLKYNVDNLMTAKMSEDQKAWASDSFDATDSVRQSKGGYAGTSTTLVSQMKLNIAFKKSTTGDMKNVYAVVNYGEAEYVVNGTDFTKQGSNYWYVPVALDHVYDIQQEITVTIYKNTDTERANPVASATDSVEIYAVRMLGQHDIYECMLKMGESAQAFNVKQSVIF